MTTTQLLQYPPLITKDPSCLVPTKIKNPQEVVSIVLSAIITIGDPKLTINLYSTFSKECMMLDQNHNEETIRKCFLEALTHLKAQLYSISRNNSPAAKSAQESKEQNDTLWSQVSAIAKLLELTFNLGELNAKSIITNIINTTAIQKIKEEQEQALTIIMCSNIREASIIEALSSASLALNVELLEHSYLEFRIKTDINSQTNSEKINAKMEQIRKKRSIPTQKQHSIETKKHKIEEFLIKSERQLDQLRRRNQNQNLLPAIKELKLSIEEHKKQLYELETELEEVTIILESEAYSYTYIDKYLKKIEQLRNSCAKNNAQITRVIEDFKSSTTRNETEAKKALTKAIVKITEEIKHNKQHCSEIIEECTALEA